MIARIVEAKLGNPKRKRVKELLLITRTKIRKRKATANMEDTILELKIPVKRDPLKNVKARIVEAKPRNPKRKRARKLLPVTHTKIRKRKMTANTGKTPLGLKTPAKQDPLRKVIAGIAEARPGNLNRKKVK